MTLVDTSIWIDHLQKRSPPLENLLQGKQGLTHPWIIGELAGGMIKNRNEILALLQALPEGQVAEYHKVLAFIESKKLLRLELGWVDVNLLASAQLTGCNILTGDISLQNSASKLHLSS